jgi:hypothetical protein
MELDKETVVNLVRERAGSEQASQVERVLPENVEHHQCVDLLKQLGLDPKAMGLGTAGEELGEQQPASWIDRIRHLVGR